MELHLTDYAPIIVPVPWDNSFSTVFPTLLSICATDLVVAHFAPVGIPAYTMTCQGAVNVRAGVLLRRELVARLNTGSLDHSVDRWDPIAGANLTTTGKAAADRFALLGTVPAGDYWGSAEARFSLGVPRKTGLDVSNLFDRDSAIAFYTAGLDVSNLFDRDSAIAFYTAELAAVIAAVGPLVAAVAAQAVLNTAQDSVVAGVVAGALVTARAGYVSQVAGRLPDARICLMPFDIDVRDSDFRRDPERPRSSKVGIAHLEPGPAVQ
jgi:hypothetical protein